MCTQAKHMYSENRGKTLKQCKCFLYNALLHGFASSKHQLLLVNLAPQAQHGTGAGQAIVQMAHSWRDYRQEWAIKFFMSKADFKTELPQYSNDNPLKRFLPQV